MNIDFKKWVAAFSAVLLLSAPVLVAEESEEAAGITQGEAARQLVLKMGLWVDLDTPPTPEASVRLLMQRGIRPFGGWQAGETLMEHDLARILVFALNEQGEIPQEEWDNPETTAFRDLLLAEYGLDLSSLRESLAVLTPAGVPPSLPEGDGTTDPLDGRGIGAETGTAGMLVFPVSDSMLAGAIGGVVPAPGDGPSGRPGGGVSTTPVVPTP